LTHGLGFQWDFQTFPKQTIYEKELIQQQKHLELYPNPVFQKEHCTLIKRFFHNRAKFSLLAHIWDTKVSEMAIFRFLDTVPKQGQNALSDQCCQVLINCVPSGEYHLAE
jgi:hypothetical protein